jgi:hypothetical protein
MADTAKITPTTIEQARMAARMGLTISVTAAQLGALMSQCRDRGERSALLAVLMTNSPQCRVEG